MALETFSVINHKSTNNNITNICKIISLILLETTYNPMNNKHNILGVIASGAVYTNLYTDMFSIPAVIGLYNKTIPKDTTKSKIRIKEVEHSTKINNRALYLAANKACINFFTTVVNKTWYKEIKSVTNF